MERIAWLRHGLHLRHLVICTVIEINVTISLHLHILLLLHLLLIHQHRLRAPTLHFWQLIRLILVKISISILLINHIWVSQLLVKQVTIFLEVLKPAGISMVLRLNQLHLVHILIHIILLLVHLVHLIHLHLLILLIELHLLLFKWLIVVQCVLGSHKSFH